MTNIQKANNNFAKEMDEFRNSQEYLEAMKAAKIEAYQSMRQDCINMLLSKTYNWSDIHKIKGNIKILERAIDNILDTIEPKECIDSHLSAFDAKKLQDNLLKD